jgi:hypothetical protein
MRRAQSWLSSGSSQRRWSKSHVPAELRWCSQQDSAGAGWSGVEFRSFASNLALQIRRHLQLLHLARTHLTMHCIRTRMRQNPRDSRCLLNSGSAIPFLCSLSDRGLRRARLRLYVFVDLFKSWLHWIRHAWSFNIATCQSGSLPERQNISHKISNLNT